MIEEIIAVVSHNAMVKTGFRAPALALSAAALRVEPPSAAPVQSRGGRGHQRRPEPKQPGLFKGVLVPGRLLACRNPPHCLDWGVLSISCGRGKVSRAVEGVSVGFFISPAPSYASLGLGLKRPCALQPGGSRHQKAPLPLGRTGRGGRPPGGQPATSDVGVCSRSETF